MVGQAILQIFLLIVGFVLLVFGADYFVDGASGIAEKLHVSTFIIGLTVVAIGTSAPEAAVSLVGAIQGEGDVIVGNVVGSNIMNILLILGITSLICKIPVEKSSQRIEIPFLIAISAFAIGLGFWGSGYQWYDGVILLCLYALFLTYTILMAKRNKSALAEGAVTSISVEETSEVHISGIMGLKVRWDNWYGNMKSHVWFLILITLIGLAMVVGGAQLVVDSATFIAEDLLKIDTKIVALTVVAFGTSLPELVTSITAARKGDMGLATGNIIGSNIANLLFVAGLGFSFSSSVIGFTTVDLVDLLVSLGAAVLLLISSINKDRSLNRITGIIMLLCLVGYYSYLFIR